MQLAPAPSTAPAAARPLSLYAEWLDPSGGRADTMLRRSLSVDLVQSPYDGPRLVALEVPVRKLADGRLVELPGERIRSLDRLPSDVEAAVTELARGLRGAMEHGPSDPRRGLPAALGDAYLGVDTSWGLDPQRWRRSGPADTLDAPSAHALALTQALHSATLAGRAAA